MAHAENIIHGYQGPGEDTLSMLQGLRLLASMTSGSLAVAIMLTPVRTPKSIINPSSSTLSTLARLAANVTVTDASITQMVGLPVDDAHSFLVNAYSPTTVLDPEIAAHIAGPVRAFSALSRALQQTAADIDVTTLATTAARIRDTELPTLVGALGDGLHHVALQDPRAFRSLAAGFDPRSPTRAAPVLAFLHDRHTTAATALAGSTLVHPYAEFHELAATALLHQRRATISTLSKLLGQRSRAVRRPTVPRSRILDSRSALFEHGAGTVLKLWEAANHLLIRQPPGTLREQFIDALSIIVKASRSPGTRIEKIAATVKNNEIFLETPSGLTRSDDWFDAARLLPTSTLEFQLAARIAVDLLPLLRNPPSSTAAAVDRLTEVARRSVTPLLAIVMEMEGLSQGDVRSDDLIARLCSDEPLLDRSAMRSSVTGALAVASQMASPQNYAHKVKVNLVRNVIVGGSLAGDGGYSRAKGLLGASPYLV